MNEEKNIGISCKVIAHQIKRTIDKSLNHDITHNQMFILGFIKKNETKRDIFQKDIEKKLDIRRSTTTEILNLMETNQLIKRVPVKEDKRQKKLILSSKGNNYVKEFRQNIIKIEKKFLTGITSEEQEVFFNVIEKIKNNINNLKEEE